MEFRQWNPTATPLLLPAIAFIAGILVAGYSSTIWIPIGFVGLSALLYILRRFYLALLILWSACGFIVGIIGKPLQPPQGIYGKNETFSGVVTRMDEGESTRNMIIRVDSINHHPSGKFSVYAVSWSFLPEISVSDRIVFASSLEPLDTSIDVPDEFNYGEYLYRNGVTASCFIESSDSILKVFKEPGILHSLTRFRKEIVDKIASSALNSESKNFLITTLTGDRLFLTSDARENFSKAGIAHVLALSGLHVAIITMVLSLVMFPLTILRVNKLKGLVIVLLLWLYAIITGLSPSVVRSVIMASVFTLGFILERRPSPINSLCFAAICILIFSPLAIYSIGFQLSFSAVIFIIIFADRLNPVNKRDRLLYIVTGWFTTTFAAAMGTGIFSAYYFHVFPAYFLLANIPFTILLPFAIGGGVIFVIFSFMGFHPHWLVWTIDTICGILHKIAYGVASMPGASVDNIYVSPLRLVFFVIMTALVVWMLYYPSRKSVSITLICIFIFSVINLIIPTYKTDNNIYIPRQHRYCTILSQRGHILEVFTDAKAPELSDIESKLRRRYSDFMVKRGLDSISVQCIERVKISKNLSDLLLTDTIVSVLPDRRTYLIISNGFKPYYVDQGVWPDTIYLSPSLNKFVADRIAERFSLKGHTVMNIKSQSLIINP